VCGKSILSKIQALSLRSDDKGYVNLDDLAEYFDRVLEIPLPGLLFPSKKEQQPQSAR